MPRSFRSILLVLAFVLAAIATVPAAGGAPGSQLPSLRLLSVLHHTDVVRFEGDPGLFISPGVYVAATGGAFEIDAFKGEDGSIELWQIRRDGQGAHRVRQLTPPEPVSFFDGLPAFLHVVLRDPSATDVAEADLPFCPSGGFGLSRVDASGPDQPSFPYFCGSDLTRAAVWGIDKGWAAGLFLVLDAGVIPDGDYTLDISISPDYARQLQIPAKLASATIGITLTTETSECPPDFPCKPATARTAARRASAGAEGPRNVRRTESAGSDGVHGGGAGGLPDLAALPAHSLFAENNPEDGHDYLDFGATIWNAGSGPLVVEGFRAGDAEVMPATQYIYRNGSPSRGVTVGQFEFDRRPGHNHWHMEDIAQYDLLNAAGSRVVLSDKQSFCLAPTDPVDLTLPGAAWQPDRQALWSACGGEDSIWLREVLPAGWGDTYFQYVAGQSFDITGLPNGRYQLRVTTDPAHTMLETSYANNASLLPIEIGGEPGNRTVDIVTS